MRPDEDPAQVTKEKEGLLVNYPILDTGSAPLLILSGNTTFSTECSNENTDLEVDDDPFGGHNQPIQEDSAACREFDYSIKSDDGTCEFKITYGGGAASAEGGVYMVDSVFLGSIAEPANSSSNPEGQKNALWGRVYGGHVYQTDTCELSFGIMGLDAGEESVVSQFAMAGVIGRKAVGMCATLDGAGAFLTMGADVPDVPLVQFPMYSGGELVGLELNNAEFQASAEILNKPGLRDHYFSVIDAIEVGRRFQGPYSALLDSGYAFITVPSEMRDALLDAVDQNLGVNTTKESTCFVVPSNESVAETVNSVVPTITITFQGNNASISIPPGLFSIIQEDTSSQPEAENSTLVCLMLGVSPNLQQVSLGTSFFLNNFVQMDSDGGYVRLTATETCEFPNWTQATDSRVRSSGVQYTSPSFYYSAFLAVALHLIVQHLVFYSTL